MTHHFLGVHPLYWNRNQDEPPARLVSSPIGSVERVLLNGLAQVLGLNAGRSLQVSNRARHLEDAIMRASGKPKALAGRLESLLAIGRDGTVFAHQFWRHLGVRIEFFAVPFELHSSGAPRTLAELSISASPRSSLYFTARTSM